LERENGGSNISAFQIFPPKLPSKNDRWDMIKKGGERDFRNLKSQKLPWWHGLHRGIDSACHRGDGRNGSWDRIPPGYGVVAFYRKKSKVYYPKINIRTMRHTSLLISGLPDGLFSNQPHQFLYILEALWIENFGIFYDHLIYFVAICFILWQFGICCGHSLYYPHFGILYHEKSGNPGLILCKTPCWPRDKHTHNQ
jgi:hypothetical protein